jgi:hypothetical protein
MLNYPLGASTMTTHTSKPKRRKRKRRRKSAKKKKRKIKSDENVHQSTRYLLPREMEPTATFSLFGSDFDLEYLPVIETPASVITSQQSSTPRLVSNLFDSSQEKCLCNFPRSLSRFPYTGVNRCTKVVPPPPLFVSPVQRLRSGFWIIEHTRLSLSNIRQRVIVWSPLRVLCMVEYFWVVFHTASKDFIKNRSFLNFLSVPITKLSIVFYRSSTTANPDVLGSIFTGLNTLHSDSLSVDNKGRLRNEENKTASQSLTKPKVPKTSTQITSTSSHKEKKPDLLSGTYKDRFIKKTLKLFGLHPK